MNKPISVVVDEFEQNLIQTINNSGLHISIATLVTEKVLSNMRTTAAQVLQQDAAEYKKLTEQKEKEASE